MGEKFCKFRVKLCISLLLILFYCFRMRTESYEQLLISTIHTIRCSRWCSQRATGRRSSPRRPSTSSSGSTSCAASVSTTSWRQTCSSISAGKWRNKPRKRRIVLPLKGWVCFTRIGPILRLGVVMATEWRHNLVAMRSKYDRRTQFYFWKYRFM